jgi:hypothetical protein
MGVAAGVPIMVTPIPIFADIEGAIQTEGLSPENIVECIKSCDEKKLSESREKLSNCVIPSNGTRSLS